MTEIRL